MIYLGKPQKKVLLLMAGPLRPNPKLERWKKKVPIKVIFSLIALPFTPPPLLMAQPLREEFFVLQLPLVNIFIVSFSLPEIVSSILAISLGRDKTVRGTRLEQ